MNFYLKFVFFQNLFKKCKISSKIQLEIIKFSRNMQKYALKIQICNLHIKYALILEICKNMHL